MKTIAIDLKSPIRVSIQAIMMMLALLISLTGCAGNWRLVSFQPGLGGGGGWHVYTQLEEPEDATEQAAVQVAADRKSREVGNAEVMFIMQDRWFSYVYAVEKGEDGNWLGIRTFTRFVVAGGKIAARSDRTREFLVDADFERAVLRDASMAGGIDSVLIYYDILHPVSMSSRPLSPCAAEVRIFQEGETGGRPMARKVVNYCALKKLKEPHG
ncbi:hypothetical protein GMSM_23850 [Geomonas sp. Red276]